MFDFSKKRFTTILFRLERFQTTILRSIPILHMPINTNLIILLRLDRVMKAFLVHFSSSSC
jgi:hypothetical protein